MYIFIHKGKVSRWDEISERLIRMDIKVFGRTVVVIGAYAPSNNGSQNVKDSFGDDLKAVLEEVKPTTPC